MMSRIHTTRREWLIGGATGLAASWLAGGTSLAYTAQPELKPSRADKPAALPSAIKLSLAGYTFRKELDQLGKPGKMSLFDMVDLCAELGLDAIEPTSYYFLKTDDDYILALKRRAFLAGLEISGMPIKNNFVVANEKAIEEQVAEIGKWVDIAAKLGAPTMRVFAGSPSKEITREQAFEHVVAGLTRACQIAGQKGVFLAIENHGYMTETADDVIKIIEAVKSPWLGMNLDTGNFTEDPYANIAKAAPYAIVAQIKMDLLDPATKKRTPADYARIVKILRDAKYRGYLALEYEGEDPATQVPILIRKLQEILRTA